MFFYYSLAFLSFEFNILLFLMLRVNEKSYYMTIMDCRIIDNKVVLTDGSIVSVPADYFEDPAQTDCYFGKVLNMVMIMVNKQKFSGSKATPNQLRMWTT